MSRPRSESRIAPWMAFAGLAYLLLDVASVSGGGLRDADWALAVIILIIGVLPVFVARTDALIASADSSPGTSRVRALALVTAFSATPLVRLGALSYASVLASGVALAAVGSLVLDLALTVPDRPRALERWSWLLRAPWV